jgi:hypothetical protein
MNANDLSGYEVEIRRNTTQIKVSDSPDLRDHELIIARRGDAPRGNARERLTRILHELNLEDLQARFDY